MREIIIKHSLHKQDGCILQVYITDKPTLGGVVTADVMIIP